MRAQVSAAFDAAGPLTAILAQQAINVAAAPFLWPFALAAFATESIARCSVSSTAKRYACRLAPQMTPEQAAGIVSAAAVVLPPLSVLGPVVGPLTSVLQSLCRGEVPGIGETLAIVGAVGQASGSLTPEQLQALGVAERGGPMRVNDPKQAAIAARAAAKAAKETAKRAAVAKAKELAKQRALQLAQAARTRRTMQSRTTMTRSTAAQVRQGELRRATSADVLGVDLQTAAAEKGLQRPAERAGEGSGSLLFAAIGAVVGTVVGGPGLGTVAGAVAGAAVARRAA